MSETGLSRRDLTVVGPRTATAAPCYGDSGGPNFLGAGSSETNVIAATTIAGDTPCRSTNVDYRLDTAARFFVES
jgi:hypothetical protein